MSEMYVETRETPEAIEKLRKRLCLTAGGMMMWHAISARAPLCLVFRIHSLSSRRLRTRDVLGVCDIVLAIPKRVDQYRSNVPRCKAVSATATGLEDRRGHGETLWKSYKPRSGMRRLAKAYTLDSCQRPDRVYSVPPFIRKPPLSSF